MELFDGGSRVSAGSQGKDGRNNEYGNEMQRRNNSKMSKLTRKETLMNRKAIGALLTTLLIFTFGVIGHAANFNTPKQLVAGAKSAIKEVSIQDLRKMIDNKENIIILDVRDRDEYEKQRIPGAIHMSRGLLDLHVDEIIPNKNAKIVVY